MKMYELSDKVFKIILWRKFSQLEKHMDHYTKLEKQDMTETSLTKIQQPLKKKLEIQELKNFITELNNSLEF